MNFNSIGSSSNYARAAQYSANDFVKIAKAARSNNPDYGQMVINAGERRSKERQASLNAEAAVAIKGIQAKGEVTGKQIVGEATRKRDKARRKAGALAAAGKMFSGAGGLFNEKRKKREIGGEDSWFDEQQQRAKEKAAQLRAQAQGINIDGDNTSTGGATNSNTDGGGTSFSDPGGSTSGGSTSGGSTSGGNTAAGGQTLAQSYGKEWNALQTVVRHVEGTSGKKGYTTRFGGHQFEGFGAHPNIAAPTPWGTKSEAAGAFQFMKPTWDEAQAALNLPDFSPESQQKAGRFLTERRGVNPDSNLSDFNDFTRAISKLSPEWAGLPNSANGRTGYHGQANADMKELHQLYLQTLNGGL